MSYRSAQVLCAWLLLGLSAAYGGGETLTAQFDAARDTTIYADNLDLANGAGAEMVAGTNANGDVRRGLVYFDLASTIPAGSTITQAALYLSALELPKEPVNVALHRLFEDWGEGKSDAAGSPVDGAQAEEDDATWKNRFYEVQEWGVAGGTFEPAPSDTVKVEATGEQVFFGSGMIADVQAWLDGTADNHGWILLGADGDGDRALTLATCTYNAPSGRPRLVISFTPPATGEGEGEGEPIEDPPLTNISRLAVTVSRSPAATETHASARGHGPKPEAAC